MKYAGLTVVLFSIAVTLFGQPKDIVPLSKAIHSNDLASLASFAPALKGKRIVFLGDIIHGEANIDSARAAIINYLVTTQGFNTLAFESGIYDLYIANKQLKTGDDVEGILNESIYGVWSGASLQPLIDVITKHRKNISLIGFDPKFSGANYVSVGEDLNTYLKKAGIRTDSSIIEEWQAICSKLAEFDLSDLDPGQARRTLKKINSYTQEVSAKNSEDRQWRQIIQTVENFYNAFNEIGLEGKTASNFKPKDGNPRDSLMALNLKFYLDLFPDSKVICWGASAHFAKTVQPLQNAEMKLFKPMGSYFGSEALHVGAMGFSGSYGWSGNVHTMPTAPVNSVEADLNTTSKGSTLVNLELMTSKMPLYSTMLVEGQPISGDWNQVFDWVIFVNEVLPKSYFTIPAISTASALNSSTVESVARITERKEILLVSKKGILVHGTVLNDKKEPLPFSTIILKNSSIGTVADEKGLFNFRLPTTDAIDTIICSNVAYESFKISAERFLNKHEITIRLKPKTVTLPEVIIKSGVATAVDVINKAINAIPLNYPQGKLSYKILQRSILDDSVSHQLFSIDWIGESHLLNGYNGKVTPHDMQFMHARKGSYSSDGERFAYMSYKPVVEDFLGLFLHDLVLYKNRDFFNKSNHKFYHFELADVVTENDAELFKINFVCSKVSTQTAVYARAVRYTGSIFINSSDYAVVRIETEQINHLKTIPNAVTRRIASYTKQNDRYLLTRSSVYDNYSHKRFQDFYYFDYKTEFTTLLPDNKDISKEPYDDAYWQRLLQDVVR